MTEQTKTITFEGQQYDVPVWVNWVVRDSAGYIEGFEYEPNSNVWEGEFIAVEGRTYYIGHIKDWDESLTKV